MGQLDPQLETLRQQNPDAVVNLLVHVNGNPKDCAQAARELGFTVRHTFHLIPLLALQGPVHALDTLCQAPWASRIEIDQEIHTCP